jgi:hypothetical protein
MVVAMKLAPNYEELADKALVTFYYHNTILHGYKIAFIMKIYKRDFLMSQLFFFFEKAENLLHISYSFQLIDDQSLDY